MVCGNCKNQVEDGLVFCPNCGNNLIKSSEDEAALGRAQKALNDAQHKIGGLEAELAAKKPASKTPAVVLGVLSFILLVVCIALGSQYMGTNSKYQDALSRADKYYSLAQELVSGDFIVSVEDVFNSDGTAALDRDMIAASTKYLDIKYKILTYGSPYTYSGKEMQVRYFRPDGSLMTGEKSGTGYSFTVNVPMGSGTTGWGNANGGNYTPGIYLIQFVYDDKVVGEKAIVLK